METAEFCISIYSNDNRVNLYYNGTEVTAEAYESIVAASGTKKMINGRMSINSTCL